MEECVVFSKMGKCLLACRSRRGGALRMRVSVLCNLLVTLQRFSNGCASFVKLHGHGVALAEGAYVGAAIFHAAHEHYAAARLKAVQVVSLLERLFGAMLSEHAALERAEVDQRMQLYSVKNELSASAENDPCAEETIPALRSFEDGYVRPLLGDFGAERNWMTRLFCCEGVFRVALVNPRDGSVALEHANPVQPGGSTPGLRRSALWNAISCHLVDQHDTRDVKLTHPLHVLRPTPSFSKSPLAPVAISLLYLQTPVHLCLLVFLRTNSGAFAPGVNMAAEARGEASADPALEFTVSSDENLLSTELRHAIHEAAMDIHAAFAGDIDPLNAFQVQSGSKGRSLASNGEDLGAGTPPGRAFAHKNVSEKHKEDIQPSEPTLHRDEPVIDDAQPSLSVQHADRGSGRSSEQDCPPLEEPSQLQPSTAQPRKPSVARSSGAQGMRPLPFVRSPATEGSAAAAAAGLQDLKPRPPPNPKPHRNFRRRKQGEAFEPNDGEQESRLLARSASEGAFRDPLQEPSGATHHPVPLHPFTRSDSR